MTSVGLVKRIIRHDDGPREQENSGVASLELILQNFSRVNTTIHSLMMAEQHI